MGSIHRYKTKAGKPRWAAMFRDGAGRQRKKVFAKRKLAVQWLTETTAEVQAGTWKDVETLPMSEVFSRWLKHRETLRLEGSIKASTFDLHESLLRTHIAPEQDGRPLTGGLGAYPSDKLTVRTMAEWRHEMAQKIAAGNLGAGAFNNAFGVLRQVLRWARRQGYLRNDPLEDQAPMREPKNEATYLEQEQVAALLRAVAGRPDEAAFVLLGIGAGLRRSEVFGLKWKDVEAGGDGGQLCVRRIAYRGRCTAPKTRAGVRTVYVPARVVDALDTLRRDRNGASDDDFVFPCGLRPDRWIRPRWPKIIERAGLPESVTPHALRHSFASMMLANGESLKFVSSQLGHSSIKITCDTYGHVMESHAKAATARLDETLRAAERPRLEIIEGGTA